MSAISQKTYNSLKSILSINWIKTLYINFYMLPFGDAVKFPIIIYGRCRLNIRGGKITFNVPICKGLLKIGTKFEQFITNVSSYIVIKGEVIVNGQFCFARDIALNVAKEGIISLGHNSVIGSKSIIVCNKEIVLSGFSRIGAHAYISDSNYHFVKDTESGVINQYLKPVYIGDHNWVGMKVSIMPGTRTPNNLIVGLGSVCNKDYTKTIPENSLIAGMPAKLLKSNVVRIFDFEKEVQIHNYFNTTNADQYVDL